MSRTFIPSRLRNIPNIAEHNFLVNGIIVDYLTLAARQYARGVLVDVGCGEKPYRSVFANHVESHVGIDIKNSVTGDAVDVIGDAYETSLPDQSCDTILCTEVLEHLEDPPRALLEMRRILRPDGHVILTVPFFWHLHEVPRDFYRYSEFGLRHQFEAAQFEIVEIRPLTGFLVTFAQLGIYYARSVFPRGRRVFRFPFWALQHACGSLNRFDRSQGFSAIYGLVARRRA
jgi:ubiquinone/menaquinone biosynthesis C-methylase UbiE